MVVAGIDLAGPSNSSNTAVALFGASHTRLTHMSTEVGADDRGLLDIISAASADGPVIVGLDAPLSYNPGGGDRPGDKDLRLRVRQAGLASGSVMTPTMSRMVYLTLRGVCVARALETIQPIRPRVIEVHPSASLALRGAPIGDVRSFKREARARRRLLEWLEGQGLEGVAVVNDVADHVVAACACALAAWKWASGEAIWYHRAVWPLHPYDFAC